MNLHILVVALVFLSAGVYSFLNPTLAKFRDRGVIDGEVSTAEAVVARLLALFLIAGGALGVWAWWLTLS